MSKDRETANNLRELRQIYKKLRSANCDGETGFVPSMWLATMFNFL